MLPALESVLLKAKEHFFILARRLIDLKDEQERESRKKKLAKLTSGR